MIYLKQNINKLEVKQIIKKNSNNTLPKLRFN